MCPTQAKGSSSVLTYIRFWPPSVRLYSPFYESVPIFLLFLNGLGSVHSSICLNFLKSWLVDRHYSLPTNHIHPLQPPHHVRISLPPPPFSPLPRFSQSQLHPNRRAMHNGYHTIQPSDSHTVILFPCAATHDAQTPQTFSIFTSSVVWRHKFEPWASFCISF